MKTQPKKTGARPGANTKTPRSPRAKAPTEVEAFLAELQHPQRAEILALRKIILATDPTIGEGIKWNAPSFHTTEHFATFHLRAKPDLQLVLHRGARRRADAEAFAVDDPQGLLEWRDSDRAVINLKSLKDITARKTALTRLLRQWISQV